jgi:putative membrane protein
MKQITHADPLETTNHWLATTAWLLFVIAAYLLLTGILAPWVDLPTFGNVGFTLVLTLFALVHCTATQGLRRTLLFFALTAVVSYALEETGVRTGLVYGHYHYSDMLGTKLGSVPVLIPLAWFMMIYPSWIVARAILRGIDTTTWPAIVAQALVAAITTTAWDTVMDPGMSASGNWVWEQGGAYFGVPLLNYAGWLLTTFIVYCGAGLLWRKPQPDASAVANGFAALPVIVYALQATNYMVPSRVAALQVVAVFAMGLPALVALIRITLPDERPSSHATLS